MQSGREAAEGLGLEGRASPPLPSSLSVSLFVSVSMSVSASVSVTLSVSLFLRPCLSLCLCLSLSLRLSVSMSLCLRPLSQYLSSVCVSVSLFSVSVCLSVSLSLSSLLEVACWPRSLTVQSWEVQSRAVVTTAQVWAKSAEAAGAQCTGGDGGQGEPLPLSQQTVGHRRAHSRLTPGADGLEFFLTGAKKSPVHPEGVGPLGFRVPASTRDLNPASQQQRYIPRFPRTACGSVPQIHRTSAGCRRKSEGTGSLGHTDTGQPVVQVQGEGKTARRSPGVSAPADKPFSPCVSPQMPPMPFSPACGARSTVTSPQLGHLDPGWLGSALCGLRPWLWLTGLLNRPSSNHSQML